MRTTTDILVNYEPENVNYEKTVFDWKTCESAMIEAQIEAIKELIKRKWDNTASAFWNGATMHSIDDIALELIKEIES